MPIVPLYGHQALRDQLRDAVVRDALPASLLLHGPAGVGKQRLALWLGQLLLCTGGGERPCGKCQSCRYAVELGHPDLHWYFPRPRPKESDSSPQDIQNDYIDARQERLKSHGLYAPPSGLEGMFVATTHALVQSAALSPAIGPRKVYVVGDAERMVSQTGSDQAANAFLKLLEEPPADTTIVLTSSEPGALLPTIRSRVVAVRVPPLSDAEVELFLADPVVDQALAAESLPRSAGERLRLAGGAPGSLFGGGARDDAATQARRILEAAMEGPAAEHYRTAFAQGASKARGAFSDALDALTLLLHERARAAVSREDAPRALGATRAIEAVERAKERATGNASPQLVTIALLQELGAHLR